MFHPTLFPAQNGNVGFYGGDLSWYSLIYGIALVFITMVRFYPSPPFPHPILLGKMAYCTGCPIFDTFGKYWNYYHSGALQFYLSCRTLLFDESKDPSVKFVIPFSFYYTGLFLKISPFRHPSYFRYTLYY